MRALREDRQACVDAGSRRRLGRTALLPDARVAEVGRALRRQHPTFAGACVATAHATAQHETRARRAGAHRAVVAGHAGESRERALLIARQLGSPLTPHAVVPIRDAIAAAHGRGLWLAEERGGRAACTHRRVTAGLLALPVGRALVARGARALACACDSTAARTAAAVTATRRAAHATHRRSGASARAGGARAPAGSAAACAASSRVRTDVTRGASALSGQLEDGQLARIARNDMYGQSG
jgi:hypothetical protein